MYICNFKFFLGEIIANYMHLYVLQLCVVFDEFCNILCKLFNSACGYMVCC